MQSLSSIKSVTKCNKMNPTVSYKMAAGANLEKCSIEVKWAGRVVGSVNFSKNSKNEVVHMSTNNAGSGVKPIDVNEAKSIAVRYFSLKK